MSLVDFFVFYHSPLEQFNIGSYNTSLNYMTDYPLELINYTNSFSIPTWLDELFLLSNAILVIVSLNFLQKNISLLITEVKISTIIFLVLICNILQTFLNINSFSEFFFLLENNNNINFFYITSNYSYIYAYVVSFFCVVFCFAILYVFFNKFLSNISNTLIPLTIFQMFGEKFFKEVLKLFNSTLGQKIAQPEFFVKVVTVFMFLLIGNVQGMLPYVSTLTATTTNTLFVSVSLFASILSTIYDKKGPIYFINLLLPSGCPFFLIPLLVPIELISYSFRIMSLAVRLFANMMAGHTLLKVIGGFSWVMIFSGAYAIINLFPLLILWILSWLECGVAFIQSYIFTVLSCIYLRDIFEGH